MIELAERRMFAKTIIDSDAFVDMPLSTQALYFHLSMRADDDGFINNPRKVQRMIGASDDDMKVLLMKRFLIPFDSGIVVIKHWKIHNYIQKDRYKPTVYVEEKALITSKKNGAYTELPPGGIPSDNQVDTECIQNGYSLETQVRLGKVSKGKDRKEEKAQPLLTIDSSRELTPEEIEEERRKDEEIDMILRGGVYNGKP